MNTKRKKNAYAAGTASQKQPGQTVQVLKRLTHHKMAMFGLAFIVLCTIVAIFAPLIAPYDPTALSGSFSAAPSKEHWLGTDAVSRDTLSRLIYGARVSLSVGLGSALCTIAIGSVLGLLAGYFGGIVDMVIMRFTDILMSFPMIILMMVLSTIVGSGIWKVTLIIGCLTWPMVCRLVRSNVMSIKEQDFVKSAITSGLSRPSIIFKQILPNVVGPILVNATFSIAMAILTESSLSFLGLGITAPTPSWGNMLADAQVISIFTTMPWQWVAPGVCIVLTVLSFNFLGDGLRDALDPRNTK